jgi:hypothetical protein
MARTLLVALISCGLTFALAPDKPKNNDKRATAGPDHETGRARADEVGKGKQKGLEKTPTNKKQKPKTTR